MRSIAKLFKDTSGVTAIEFAMCGPIFFFLVFSIIETGLVYTSSISLQQGVADAARQIRTGQFQLSSGGAGEFRALVCLEGGPMLDCSGDLSIDVQTFDDFGGLEDVVVDEDELEFAPGSGSSVVVVTATYRVKLISPMIAAFLANEPNSIRRLSWTAAFQNEPF